MKRLNVAMAVLAVALLAACATTGHNLDEGLTSITPGKGLVLFSTGASETRLATSSSLRLVEGSSRKMYDKVVLSIDYPFKSYFSDEHGRVHALQLPPGEYFFVPQITNPYFATTAAPVYRFTVSAGAASYLGNFWLSGGALTWSDAKARRDIDYFVAKNPALKNLALPPQKAELATTLDKFETSGIIWGLP